MIGTALSALNQRSPNKRTLLIINSRACPSTAESLIQPDTPLPKGSEQTMAVLWWIVACGVLMSASSVLATGRETGISDSLTLFVVFCAT